MYRTLYLVLYVYPVHFLLDNENNIQLNVLQNRMMSIRDFSLYTHFLGLESKYHYETSFLHQPARYLNAQAIAPA
jgi:hypothetical protein